MSNGDFEVHPRGTAEELKFLRQLAKDLVNNNPQDIRNLEDRVRVFYEYHNEAYQG